MKNTVIMLLVVVMCLALFTNRSYSQETFDKCVYTTADDIATINLKTTDKCLFTNADDTATIQEKIVFFTEINNSVHSCEKNDVHHVEGYSCYDACKGKVDGKEWKIIGDSKQVGIGSYNYRDFCFDVFKTYLLDKPLDLSNIAFSYEDFFPYIKIAATFAGVVTKKGATGNIEGEPGITFKPSNKFKGDCGLIVDNKAGSKYWTIIKNFYVEGFPVGICIKSGGVILNNIRATKNETGVLISQPSGSSSGTDKPIIITDSLFYNNTADGIALEGYPSKKTIVINNSIFGNEIGVNVNGTLAFNTAVVINNKIYNNTEADYNAINVTGAAKIDPKTFSLVDVKPYGKNFSDPDGWSVIYKIEKSAYDKGELTFTLYKASDGTPIASYNKLPAGKMVSNPDGSLLGAFNVPKTYKMEGYPDYIGTGEKVYAGVLVGAKLSPADLGAPIIIDYDYINDLINSNYSFLHTLYFSDPILLDIDSDSDGIVDSKDKEFECLAGYKWDSKVGTCFPLPGTCPSGKIINQVQGCTKCTGEGEYKNADKTMCLCKKGYEADASGSCIETEKTCPAGQELNKSSGECGLSIKSPLKKSPSDRNVPAYVPAYDEAKKKK